MNDDRTQARDVGETEEPELTEKNSRTISAEEMLADESTEVESKLTGETSTHTKLGVIPSSYGAAGGTTDAYEEGAGEHEGEGTGI
ncbi:MAG TPA: hypothetical protein VGX96_15310 [Candidatus Elarobacter sp.]|jgi:hypothetical protein|nr:hypothetical protein [Candidatus Elarobacter sp.]